MSGTTAPAYEIIVEVETVALAEGHYAPDRASRARQVATYARLGEANGALRDVAEAEAEAHGLVLDPRGDARRTDLRALRGMARAHLTVASQVPLAEPTIYATVRVRKWPTRTRWML